MKKRIKVYGERNTNTNYMSKLIELNLNITEVSGVVPRRVMQLQTLLPGRELVRDLYFKCMYDKSLGWKHSYVKPKEELCKYGLVNTDLMFLTITKNPYSWLLSLFKKPYHQYYDDMPTFETFLQRKWKTIGRDNVSVDFCSPIELWNLKNRSYLQLDNEQTIHTTTESIFDNPSAIIAQISKQHSVDLKSDEFVNHNRSTKDKNKDFNYYRDFYLLEKWRDSFSKDAIDIVNESVDRDLMNHFGYEVLS